MAGMGVRFCRRLSYLSKTVIRGFSTTTTTAGEVLPLVQQQGRGQMKSQIIGRHGGMFSSSRRSCTTKPKQQQQQQQVILLNEHLEIEDGDDGVRLPVNYAWLRDECRCEKCYSMRTFQKNFDILQLSLDVKPKEAFLDRANHLHVLWNDGHKSQYSVEWLANNIYEGIQQQGSQEPEKILWNNEIILEDGIPEIYYGTLLSENSELQNILHSMVVFGVAIVNEVPATLEATQEVAERVGEIQKTMFGEMWQFSSNMARSDTAYTNIALGPHTDTTYLDHSVGVQIFHVLKHDGNGGETILVDGFRAATALRHKNPEAYAMLCQVPVPSEYIECSESRQHHTTGCSPILKVNPASGYLEQIRYNMYDRAPLYTISQHLMQQFYGSLRALAEEVNKPSNEYAVKLRPDQVLFVDNWRVLHGRKQFTGNRVVCGCYLGRDDFLSQIRTVCRYSV